MSPIQDKGTKDKTRKQYNLNFLVLRFPGPKLASKKFSVVLNILTKKNCKKCFVTMIVIHKRIGNYMVKFMSQICFAVKTYSK